MGMRYHMDNGVKMVEAPLTAEGKRGLEAIRSSRKDMKGRRITEVWQAYPSEIEVFQFYELTRGRRR